MDVLVTGGAGYIGSFVCQCLKEHHFNPITVDNLSQGSEKMVQFGTFYQIDLLDKQALFEVFEKNTIQAVCHLASNSLVEESMEKPQMYLHDNVQMTQNVIEACQKYNCKNIVFSSTAAVYGNPSSTPIFETAPLNPINPYGESKVLAEKALLSQENLKITIFRFFNAAGASFDGSIGEKHHPETHLIPKTIQAVLENRPVLLFGDHYPTEDGSCIRDFIHVKDLANAHIKALKMMLENKYSQHIFNLGLNKGYSVKHVIELILQKTNRPLSLEIKSPRQGDPAILIASNQKALDAGFEFNYDLDQMIDSAYFWHQAQSNYTTQKP